MRILAAGMLLALAAPVAAEEAAPAHRAPGWMAGCWEAREGERWTEECWTIPRGGMMMGSGRSGKGDAIGSFEHMQIRTQADGSVVYLAMPGGGPATEFALTQVGESDATFTNPEHDYPQRIRYWREDGKLKAEISRLDGSNAMGWEYSPMGGG